MGTPMGPLSRKLDHVLHDAFPWLSIFYARKHYAYPWHELTSMWLVAKTMEGSRDTILGDKLTQVGAFFMLLAERQYEESQNYACVYGRCIVIWHPRKGNLGGVGRPGCPCDDMKEPRDLVRGPI